MRFTRFDIKNFRGISNASLPLASKPDAHVHVLVGLNESGKTTVLEAINHIAYNVESLDALDLKGYAISDQHSLIPIAQRSNFNNSVTIQTEVELDSTDEELIKNDLNENYQIKLSKPIKKFSITRKVAFADSRYIPEKSTNIWTHEFWGTVGKERKPHFLTNIDTFQKVAKTIIPHLPSILFFPNFLFEFPDRIYLSPKENDKLSLFYKTVLQDILDSLANNTDVETHILTRAKSGDINDQRNLDGLLLEMSRHVTQTVFSAWDKMFSQKMSHKRVTLKCEKDPDGEFFVAFRLEDTDGFYQIRERSLGFRWFFVFLLLTHYRGFRKKGPSQVLFLLDEPASNLHPSAQNQLLKSFEILTKNCNIIYTTHSHHMINPNWLECTFVVKNEGLDYTTDTLEYSARKTDITVSRYRDFASKHPDQSNYFRPILDVLAYTPSDLENVPNVIMIEGKNDYYLLRYFGVLLGKDSEIYLLPGTGSGTLDTAIQLYTAWGRSFIVILDADLEGKKQSRRYQDKFGSLVENRLFTLSDLIGGNVNAAESLFDEPEKLIIQQAAFPADTVFNKTHFNRSIQEALITHRKLPLSKPTLDKFALLLDAIRAKLFFN